MYVLMIIILCFSNMGNVNAQGPDMEQVREIAELMSTRCTGSIDIGNTLKWEPAPTDPVVSWVDLKRQFLAPGQSYYADGNQIPFIMMAGYMDTEITWEEGGRFTMLAWPWDADDEIDTVEVYYQGAATGIFLLDDGFNGDFEAGDGLYGLMFDIAPYTLPEGDYILELRARDSMGNLSDLWPYLTIHP